MDNNIAGLRTRSERTQKGNPHKLTTKQHVFPARSIQRFLDGKLGVDLADGVRRKRRRAAPNDPIFCADRAWNHGIEAGFMKLREDAFQRVIEDVLRRPVMAMSDEENFAISQFYALWHVRSSRRHLSEQFVTPPGFLPGTPLGKDELEQLEKNGYATIHDGVKFATRDLNAGAIMALVGRMLRTSLKDAKWGVTQAIEGEFCVPDVPVHGIIPIEPSRALVLNAACGSITRDNLALLNGAMKQHANEYLFARSLDDCPGVMPLW